MSKGTLSVGSCMQVATFGEAGIESALAASPVALAGYCQNSIVDDPRAWVVQRLPAMRIPMVTGASQLRRVARTTKTPPLAGSIVDERDELNLRRE